MSEEENGPKITSKRIESLEEQPPLNTMKTPEIESLGQNEGVLPPVDDYFDDDEAFLRGDDEIIMDEKEMAIVKQLENTVSWSVENFYTEKGKNRNSLMMRNDPPVFSFESSNGDIVNILVTKELAGSLEKIFGDIKKAYYGIDTTREDVDVFTKEGFVLKMNQLKDWAWRNKIKLFIVVLILLVLFILPLL